MVTQNVIEADALALFVRQFPGLPADGALTDRFGRAYRLWRQNTARPLPRTPHTWTVRCEHPERTRPGEPTSYTVVLVGGPADWRCDCADAIYRRVVCKHLLATWLLAAFGPAEEPGANPVFALRDEEFEDWLDSRLEAEIGSEPPDDELAS